jgi:hypothetical protein
VEKHYIKSNTDKRNGDCMSNLEKPIKFKELALLFDVHEKTLKKHFNELRIKFPDEPCLHRHFNRKPIVYPSDLERIKECQVELKSGN